MFPTLCDPIDGSPPGSSIHRIFQAPCSPLAAVAYERLAHVRARLALEEHFEIILGNPTSGITIGKHFLKQLKVGTGGDRLLGGRMSGDDDQGAGIDTWEGGQDDQGAGSRGEGVRW